jgi:serine/threonine-protein kinase PRP4
MRLLWWLDQYSLQLFTGKRPSLSPPPESEQDQNFEIAKDATQETSHRENQQENVNMDGEDQMNAADYDPSLDRREDEHKRIKVDEIADEDEEEVEEEEEEDDIDDMFAIGTSDKPKKTVKKKVKKPVSSPLSHSACD